MSPDQLRKLGFGDGQIQGITGQAPQQTSGRGGFLSSLISETGGLSGAVAGGAAGSAFGPLGTLVGAGIGGFGGGTLGSVAEQSVRDNRVDTGKALREGALEGIFAAGPIRLGRAAVGAGKAARAGATAGQALQQGAQQGLDFSIRGALGKGAQRASNNAAVKSLGLTKGQKNNIFKNTGSSPADITGRFGIRTADDLGPKIDELQSSFDDVISRTTNPITRQTITDAFNSRISPLVTGAVPQSERKIGAALKKEMDSLLETIGDDITASELNQIRKKFDKAVKKFDLTDKTIADTNRLSRDSLADVVRQAANTQGVRSAGGQSLEELGKDLSSLRRLQEAANKNVEGPGGTSLLGLRNLLGGAGAAAAFGTPVAGLAAGAGTAALNSRAGRNATASLADRLASQLGGGGNNITQNVARGALTGSAVNSSLQSSPTSVDQSQAPTSPNNAPNTNVSNSQAPQLGNSIPDLQQQVQLMTAQAQLAVLEQGGSLEEAAQITQLIPVLLQAEGIDISGLVQEQQEPLTGDALKRSLTAQSGLRSLDTLEGTLQSDPGAFQRQALPNPLGITGRLTGTTQIRAATDNIVDVIARLRSGAAITEDEAQRFAKLLPQPGDSEEDALFKLANVRAELEGFANPR